MLALSAQLRHSEKITPAISPMIYKARISFYCVLVYISMALRTLPQPLITVTLPWL